MNTRTLLPLCAAALALLAAGRLSAQDSSYGGGGMGSPGIPGGMGGRRSDFRRRGADVGRSIPTANELEGPPIPDFFIDRFELDSGQANQYRSAYDSFMSATAAIRDSAKATRRAIDGAWQSGDRFSARAGIPRLQTLGDSLDKADGRFDNRLKTFLSSSQVKSYKKWRDDQRRQEEADQPKMIETPQNSTSPP